MANKVTSMYILAGILAPSAIAYGVRFVGQAPTNAQAEQVSFEVPHDMLFPDVVLVSDSELESSVDSESIKSPFWFEVEEYSSYMDPFEHNIDPEPVSHDIGVDVVVTSILPSTKNPLAVINSKPCRIGDEIEGGWKLVGINGTKRTVLLLHISGKKITVSMAGDR